MISQTHCILQTKIVTVLFQKVPMIFPLFQFLSFPAHLPIQAMFFSHSDSSSQATGSSNVHTAAPIVSAPLQPHHLMQTRSKFGIFKPKLFSTYVHKEPATVPLALANQALIHNHTWDPVPFSDDMNIVQCKWVFRTKFKADESLDKHKARLVAKGFQQTPGVDFFETFSPVVKASTIRIVFTLAVSKGWNIQQIDVNNAFLKGELHEDVFMTQPEGFLDANKPHHVCTQSSIWTEAGFKSLV